MREIKVNSANNFSSNISCILSLWYDGSPARDSINDNTLQRYVASLPEIIADICGVSKSVCGADSVFRVLGSNAHLLQLTAHRVPLEQGGEERQDAYPSDYSGPNDQTVSDRRQPSRFPYERVFLGTSVIALGWGCLWFSFEAFDKSSHSVKHIFVGIIFGVVAIALIGHGLFYACLGLWGLPSLYVL